MKKLLLSIVPALMLLGSCAGAQPKVENKLFQEDTLAHEEIFGSVEEAFKKAPRNNVNPDPVPPTPKIVVQQKNNEDGTVSVRFAAAVVIADENLATSSASWNRAMYAPDGSQFIEPGDKPCKTAYKSLIENGNTITAGEGIYAGYTRFVVYSMLNIPVGTEDPETPEIEDYSKYCFKVRLTVNDTPTDNIYASTVDLTKRASFDADETGYFISGVIGGIRQTVEDDATPVTGNHASFTDIVLNKDDAFILVHKTANSLSLHNTLAGDNSNALFDIQNGKIHVKYTGKYGLYFKGVDEFHSSVNYSQLSNGYYVVGDFTNWNFFAAHKMLDQDIGGNQAQYEGFSFNSLGNMQVVYLKGGEAEARFGPKGKDQSYDNYYIFHDGVFNFYVSGDKLYTVFVKPYHFEVYYEPGQQLANSSIYLMFSNNAEDTPTLENSVALSTFSKPVSNYVINGEGYDYVYVSCVVDDTIMCWKKVAYTSMANASAGFTVTSGLNAPDNYWVDCATW